MKLYKIRKGDTLKSIAKMFQTSVEWLEYVKQRNMEYQTQQQERDIERNYQSHVADAIKRFKRGTHKRR